jgi:hypothetical protein
LDVTREIEVRERLKEFYDLVRRLTKVSCNCRVNSVYSERQGATFTRSHFAAVACRICCRRKPSDCCLSGQRGPSDHG